MELCWPARARYVEIPSPLSSPLERRRAFCVSALATAVALTLSFVLFSFSGASARLSSAFITDGLIRKIEVKLRGRCAEIGLDGTKGQLGHFPDVCPEEAIPLESLVAEVRVRIRRPSLDAELLKRLDNRVKNLGDVGSRPALKFHQEALAVLHRLSNVNAKDIVAFKETWTEDDTDILRRLDNSSDGFVEGELTTEAMKARLPSIEAFNERMEDVPLAIVGSAGILKGAGLGGEIDNHPAIVRFNDHVADSDTGEKTTVHVACNAVGPLGDDNVVEFDMESDKPWASWCGKAHQAGAFTRTPHYAMPYLFRPSAYCALGPNISNHTRGFLFYWFIGRIFSSVDMYGFTGSDHFDKKDTVWEHYLPFEHLVYEEVQRQGSDLPRASAAPEPTTQQPPPQHDPTNAAQPTTTAAPESTQPAGAAAASPPPAPDPTNAAQQTATAVPESTQPAGAAAASPPPAPAAVMPENPAAAPCDNECAEFDGTPDSCRNLVNSAAVGQFKDGNNPCSQAYTEVRVKCPSCLQCDYFEVGGFCSRKQNEVQAA